MTAPPPEDAGRVRVVCTACNGRGLTVGYPNQTPTEDPGEYTCWACHGAKSLSATLAEPDAAVMRLGRAALDVHNHLRPFHVAWQCEKCLPLKQAYNDAIAAARCRSLAGEP